MAQNISFIFKKKAPIITGPPTGDDFNTGIDDWTVYKTDSDVTVDWYENDSLRVAINYGGSTEIDNTSITWNYGLEGDFDIEIEYKRLAISGLAGTDVAAYGLYIVPSFDLEGDRNNVRVLLIEGQSTMHMRYELNDSVQQNINNSPRPDPTSDNLRLRMTKVGAVFTSYHDNGDGSWKLIGQVTAAPFENEIMYPSIFAYRAYDVSFSAKFDNFKVNSGTVV